MKRFVLIFSILAIAGVLQATPDTLSVAETAVSGVAYSLSAAADDSNYVANSGDMFLVIANASGGPLTVTVYSNVSLWYVPLPDGAAASNETVTITTGTTQLIGPFNQRSWNNSDGYVLIKLSTTTSVTLAAYQFP